MRFEFAVAGAVYLLVLFGWEKRPAIGHLPAVVSALVPTVLFFVVLYGLVFLTFVVREPFVDHRKIIWERNFREHQVRSVHLRHQAHNWLNGIQNELRNISPHGIKTNPGYFDTKRVRSTIEYLGRIRTSLCRLGQPRLANELPEFSVDQILDIEDYRQELQRCQQLLTGWQSGQEFPPFAGDASDEGLWLPNPYVV